MNKHIIKRLAGMITVCMILGCIFIYVPVMETQANTLGDFSVSAVIPDNQVDKRQTYFDLRMEPEAKQTIEVVITNSRTEDLQVNLHLNPASTGRNGLIVYSEPDIRDEELKVAVTDVASLRQETVTVPASDSVTVGIDIQMPAEELEGAILGGIVVTEEKKEDNTQKAEKGVILENVITYVIGLKITENDTAIIPDFELFSITPSLINYKTATVVTLMNKKPIIVKNMSVKAQVYASGSDVPLHELVLDNSEMAPLSKGGFVIDWGNTKLKAGTYRLKMTAVYEDQEWSWDEEFLIAEEADEINKEAVDIKVDRTWIYVASICGSFIVVAVIAYQIGKKQKKDENQL